jgi:hypothetical protein
MMNVGSGKCGEFTLLDIISIASFVISLQNLDLNLTQEDIDNATADLDARVNNRLALALDEIHNHLKIQDNKLDYIMEVLNDENKSTGGRND